jgi:hypothetical protein
VDHVPLSPAESRRKLRARRCAGQLLPRPVLTGFRQGLARVRVLRAARRSRDVQDEGIIDSPQILRIRRDDMQVALPGADRNRDVHDIGVT